MGILDAVSFHQQSTALRNFNPSGFISEYLEKLKPREKQIITLRYGLENGLPETLDNIGKVVNLTRERVRQIEKETLKRLSGAALPPALSQAADLIFQIIEEHGNILREDLLLEEVLPHDNTPVSRSRVLFLLELVPRFSKLPESAGNYPAWFVSGFDRELLDQVAAAAAEVFGRRGHPLHLPEVLSELAKFEGLTEDALESCLSVSRRIGKNPYGEWGLAAWPQIRPRDVGDKAVLVLSHHGKPEHYSKITEMINRQKFDSRAAHSETVHNELIKDRRFVLVGRGIYALAEWGYKQGVVGDIIEDVLRQAQKPLSRDEIVEQVLRQRLVKRNTVIVGLANRKRFSRTADNKYEANNVQ